MRGDDITGRHLHLKRTEHMGQGSPGVSAMVQPFSCVNNKDLWIATQKLQLNTP